MAINNTIAILAALLIAAGLGTQFAAFMNIDNAWLLHVAKSVVSGAVLHRDVVETNPPLIVYLMTIPVYMANLLGISPVHMFTLFIALLGFVSLAMSFSIVKDNRIRLCLVFGLFFMPGYNYGEREHIFIILMLPYFVSLWPVEKPGRYYVVISALMAGVALSLKPFFLLIWGAVMLVQMGLERRWFAFLNRQNVIIGLLVAAYPLYLVFIEQIYVNEVLPLLLKYYGGYSSHGADLLRQSFGMILLGQVAFWILFIKDRQILTRPIYYCAFANLAAIAVMVIQGKVWSNYFYPPNFFSMLTNVLITLALFDGNVKPLWNKVAAVLASFMIVVFLTITIAVNLKTGLRVNEEEDAQLVEVFNKFATDKNVMALSFDLGTAFPAVMTSDANYAGRYGCLWMLPGIYKGQTPVKRQLVYHSWDEKGADEKAMVEAVLEDFENSKPALVVVVKGEYYSPGIGDYGFDFVKYFSMEPRFAKLWQNYEMIAVIGDEADDYRKEIYALKELE